MQIDAEERALQSRALMDHEERRELWTEAIEHFARNSGYLYGSPGTLVINVDKAGYEFRTRIDAGGSHGRGNMAIFCYDLTLAQLWASMPVSPAIVVHDSELYDPVDERQKALALRLAAEQSLERGFQYIALLNSDQLPMDDLADIGFDIEPYVRLRLTDTDPSGSLLGLRF